jgi:hypothetical protein
VPDSARTNQGYPANRDSARLGAIQAQQRQAGSVQAAMQRNRAQTVGQHALIVKNEPSEVEVE